MVSRTVLLIALFTLLFTGLDLAVSAPPDAIDTAIANYCTGAAWEMGVSPFIDLPETASTKEVMLEVVKKWGYLKLPTNFKILEVRQVRLDGSLPNPYTAALVNTDLGEVVAVIHANGKFGWWSRVLRTSPPTATTKSSN